MNKRMAVVGEQAEIGLIKARAEAVNSTAMSCHRAVFMHEYSAKGGRLSERQRRESLSERQRRGPIIA